MRFELPGWLADLYTQTVLIAISDNAKKSRRRRRHQLEAESRFEAFDYITCICAPPLFKWAIP